MELIVGQKSVNILQANRAKYLHVESCKIYVGGGDLLQNSCKVFEVVSIVKREILLSLTSLG